MDRRDVQFGRSVGILKAYPIATIVAVRLINDRVLAVELECDPVVVEPLPLNVCHARNSAKNV